MKYKIIKTADGSYTFFNEEFKDIYHNKKGALSEAYFSFLEPIKKFLKKENKFIVFDIGFGLGYNAFLIKEFLIKENKDFILFSFEKDLDLIQLINENLNLLPNEEKNEEYKKFFNEIIFLKENENLKSLKNKRHYLFLGDARKRILDVKKLIENKFYSNYYKIVLHDGFSPIKNKSLWTFEFLSTFFNFEVFITYTNHAKVRTSLLLNNFYLFKTKAFGRRDGGTLAINKGFCTYYKKTNLFYYEQLNEKELSFLLSPYGRPFTDFISFKDLFLFTSNEIKKEKNSFLQFAHLLKNYDYLKSQDIIRNLLVNSLFI
jgi:tRNA U34 5-methylaminomethyl-2-thiouridine-forming methyltransferase MnmC